MKRGALFETERGDANVGGRGPGRWDIRHDGAPGPLVGIEGPRGYSQWIEAFGRRYMGNLGTLRKEQGDGLGE